MKKKSMKKSNRSKQSGRSCAGPLDGMTLTITKSAAETHELTGGGRHVPESGDLTVKSVRGQLRFYGEGDWNENWEKCTLVYVPGKEMTDLPEELRLTDTTKPAAVIKFQDFARYQGTVDLPHDRDQLQPHDVYLIPLPDGEGPRAVLVTSAHEPGILCGSCSHVRPKVEPPPSPGDRP